MIIYKTLNIVNGKYYIGLDTKNDPNYLGSGTLLKKAIKKYGTESFNKIVLEQCTSIEQLKEQEKYWIGVYNACSDRFSYNISTGGTGGDNFSHNPNKEQIRESFKARMHTETTRQKISQNNWQKTHLGSRTGTQWTNSQRNKMKAYWKVNTHPSKGKKLSKEAIEKRTKSRAGYIHSEETKIKMSISKKGMIQPNHTCPHCGKLGKGNTMLRWHFNNCKKIVL
jgi:hypothetical protein